MLRRFQLSYDENKSIHWESVRGISLLSIMFLHVSIVLGWDPILPNLPAMAFPSIELIILLSGFLICRSSCKRVFETNEPMGKILKLYGIRRIIRTWPLYFLYVLIIYNLPPSFTGRITVPLWELLTFTFNINFDFTAPGKGNYYILHLWSACLEEWCYLFFLFLIPFLRHRWVNYAFLLLAIYPIATRYYMVMENEGPIMDYYRYGAKIHVGTFVRWDSFWWGCLLGRWYYLNDIKNKLSQKTMIQFLFIGLAIVSLYAYAFYNAGDWFAYFKNYFNPVVGALASVFFILGIRAIPAKWLRLSLLPHIGYRAYTIYLVHFALMISYMRFRNTYLRIEPHSYFEILYIYLFVLIISFVLFELGEKHILRYMEAKFRTPEKAVNN